VLGLEQGEAMHAVGVEFEDVVLVLGEQVGAQRAAPAGERDPFDTLNDYLVELHADRVTASRGTPSSESRTPIRMVEPPMGAWACYVEPAVWMHHPRPDSRLPESNRRPLLPRLTPSPAARQEQSSPAKRARTSGASKARKS
jgi:hypothetical protein